LSGIILSLGIFFSLSIIPIIIMLLIWLSLKKDFSLEIKKKLLSKFFFGFLIFPLLLLAFGYNSFSNALVILHGQAHRSYFLWLFYNLYDFFLFTSLPVSILFFAKLWKKTKKGFSLPLIITLIFLTLSGLSRAETGRIWLVMMPFVVIEGISFLKTKNIKSFIFIFSLIVAQTLVISQFWVTLW